LQTCASFAHDFSEAGNLGFENSTSGQCEPVVATAGIVVTSAPAKFFHTFPLNQFLQIVLQRARAELVFSFGLAGDLLHDAVAVKVFSG